MQEPYEYQQIFYNELIYWLEQKWGRLLNDHEKHLLIEGYRFGRLKESEQEMELWYK